MSKSEIKAQEIISLIQANKSVDEIKGALSVDPDDWNRYSSKAYQLTLKKELKERKDIHSKPHLSATSNKHIDDLLDLNSTLSNYALFLPSLSTIPELRFVQQLLPSLPKSKPEIMKVIGRVTMSPRIRALQKMGRIEKFEYFKPFVKLIDAATLCYYRANYISCYLTLVPVIEGIIIRWLGYIETSKKPEFEEIRNFFKNSYQRQPCPYNIIFHNIYTKACNAILNRHFYKPTETGNSYGNFNRHIASHLLTDSQFATNENCVRLFSLIDAMTEIYYYEKRIDDPRFYINNQELEPDVTLYATLMLDNIRTTPEYLILY